MIYLQGISLVGRHGGLSTCCSRWRRSTSASWSHRKEGHCFREDCSVEALQKGSDFTSVESAPSASTAAPPGETTAFTTSDVIKDMINPV